MIVFGSIYQGAILVHVFEPQPFQTIAIHVRPSPSAFSEASTAQPAPR